MNTAKKKHRNSRLLMRIIRLEKEMAALRRAQADATRYDLPPSAPNIYGYALGVPSGIEAAQPKLYVQKFDTPVPAPPTTEAPSLSAFQVSLANVQARTQAAIAKVDADIAEFELRVDEFKRQAQAGAIPLPAPMVLSTLVAAPPPREFVPSWVRRLLKRKG